MNIMYHILNCIKIKKNAPIFKNIRKIRILVFM